MKTLFFTAVLTLSSYAHAGLFGGGSLSPAFNGRVLNTTSIPNSELELRVDTQCFSYSSGYTKVCSGHQEVESTTIAIQNDGTFTFPEIKKPGFGQHLKTQVVLQIKSGVNVSNQAGSRKVSGGNYEYSLQTPAALASAGFNRDEEGFDELKETLQHITVGSFAPANLMKLTVKGRPLEDVLKVSKFLFLQVQLIVNTENSYVSTSQVIVSFVNGIYDVSNRVSQKPELPMWVYAHAGKPFSSYEYDVRVTGSVTATDGSSAALSFNYVTSSDLQKNQQLLGWPFDIKVQK